MKANTGNLIEGMEIKGTLGKLYAKADRIDLGKEIARLTKSIFRTQPSPS